MGPNQRWAWRMAKSYRQTKLFRFSSLGCDRRAMVHSCSARSISAWTTTVSGLAGVASNTLSARFKTLETQGVIERRRYSEHPPRLEYQFAEKGKGLGPVLTALKKWGYQYG